MAFCHLAAPKRAADRGEDTYDYGMKAIVGLGNPGKQYAGTRHNIGFMVVDRLASIYDAPPPKTRFKSSVTEVTIGTEKVVLLKPQTYMNLSGDAVRLMGHWYKLYADEILIVLDELDLPFGTLRLRERGSAGGHNGLASVIQRLGTNEFPRLRIGIGRGRSQAKAHVLSRFTDIETAELPAIIDRAVDACTIWTMDGPVPAMNKVNATAAAAVDTEGKTGV
ncbi:MAG: aminoacyl-tRNA hydrolase [Thermomicrobiales bacterium]|nr:aminoacyl-tRNA hydrolase [Thermomicrobiales bacterium]